MPPEWMWSLDEELNEWFKEVDSRRKEKYGIGASQDESTPMMTNDLADSRR